MTKDVRIEALDRAVGILNEKYNGLCELLRPAQSIGTPIRISTDKVCHKYEGKTIYYGIDLPIYGALQAIANHLGMEWKYQDD